MQFAFLFEKQMPNSMQHMVGCDKFETIEFKSPTTDETQILSIEPVTGCAIVQYQGTGACFNSLFACPAGPNDLYKRASDGDCDKDNHTYCMPCLNKKVTIDETKMEHPIFPDYKMKQLVVSWNSNDGNRQEIKCIYSHDVLTTHTFIDHKTKEEIIWPVINNTVIVNRPKWTDNNTLCKNAIFPCKNAIFPCNGKNTRQPIEHNNMCGGYPELCEHCIDNGNIIYNGCGTGKYQQTITTANEKAVTYNFVYQDQDHRFPKNIKIPFLVDPMQTKK